MKKIIEKTIIYILFIMLLILFFDKATLLFVRKGNSYGTDVLNFYKQERNSIDVLVLGSSHAYSAIDPYLIEEKTGLTAYDFCTQQQPIWITYYYLKEALKTQNPTYVILDIHMVLSGDTDYAGEAATRDAIDKMKMSKNKIEAIKNSVENTNDRYAYYFNIIKYHSRYKSLTDDDYQAVLQGKTVDNKGYTKLPSNDYVFPGITKTKETNEIYSKNLEYFNKIVELSKNNNIKLILVKTPAYYDDEMMKKLNSFIKIAALKELPFYDYINGINKLGLDYNNDFYDTGHLSGTGSYKFTNQIIKDLNL